MVSPTVYREALLAPGRRPGAVPVAEERLTAEEIIESAVESAPELLGIDVLIIGRQVPTPSGPLDLLAIDGEAHVQAA